MAFYATDIGEQASPKTKTYAEVEMKQIPSLIHIRKRMWHRAVMRMFRQNIHTMCASVFHINVFNTMNLIVIVKRACIRITCDVYNVSDRQRICSFFFLQLTLCSLYLAFFFCGKKCVILWPISNDILTNDFILAEQWKFPNCLVDKCSWCWFVSIETIA